MNVVIIRSMANAVLAIRLMAALAGTTHAMRGIPEPDALLYGPATIEGAAVQQQQEVAVVARLQGEQEVGRFRFNDCNGNGVPDTCELDCNAAGCSGVSGCGTARDSKPQDGLLDDCAGHLYVLRIRSESVPEGLSPSGQAVVLDAANPPAVKIYLQAGDGPERLAREFVVSERGKIRDLGLLPADLHALPGFIECFNGPADSSPPPKCSAVDFTTFDYDENGRVDLRDYAFVQDAFGATSGISP